MDRAVARQRPKLPVGKSNVDVVGYVHLVVGRHGIPVEQLVIQLKGEATAQLESEGIHPFAKWKREGKRIPRCWVRGEWKVFLAREDLPRAIGYVEGNPVKEGKKRQRWSFVVPYVPG